MIEKIKKNGIKGIWSPSGSSTCVGEINCIKCLCFMVSSARYSGETEEDDEKIGLAIIWQILEKGRVLVNRKSCQ